MKRLNDRKRNLVKIINTLMLEGAMSQTELSKRLQLQTSTLSYLMNDLKRLDLVVNSGQTIASDGPGKPATIIRLNPDKAYFLGLYVEVEKILAYIVGLDGSIIHRQSFPLDPPTALEACVSQAIRAILDQYPLVEGIGIAMKGLVLNDDAIRFGQRDKIGFKSWQVDGLMSHLHSAFNKPIMLENDANCVAVLHQYHQQRSDMDLILYLLNQSPFGIGCAILSNGELIKGSRGAAGQYFEKGSPFIRPEEIARRETETLNHFLEKMLEHILTTSYLLDPEEVILTGNIFKDDQQSNEQTFLAGIAQYPFPMQVNIRNESQKFNPGMGAAMIAANQYIRDTIEKVGAR